MSQQCSFCQPRGTVRCSRAAESQLLAAMDLPQRSLLDLPDDLLQKVIASLELHNRCRVESVCRRLHSLLALPGAWPDIEAVLTDGSLNWLRRRAKGVQSLTLKSPLALQPGSAPIFENRVCELCQQATLMTDLRLWGPAVALASLPCSLQSIKLDCWRYRQEDLQALGRLPKLKFLTVHFLGVRCRLLTYFTNRPSWGFALFEDK